MKNLEVKYPGYTNMAIMLISLTLVGFISYDIIFNGKSLNDAKTGLYICVPILLVFGWRFCFAKTILTITESGIQLKSCFIPKDNVKKLFLKKRMITDQYQYSSSTNEIDTLTIIIGKNEAGIAFPRPFKSIEKHSQSEFFGRMDYLEVDKYLLLKYSTFYQESV